MCCLLTFTITKLNSIRILLARRFLAYHRYWLHNPLSLERSRWLAHLVLLGLRHPRVQLLLSHVVLLIVIDPSDCWNWLVGLWLELALLSHIRLLRLLVTLWHVRLQLAVVLRGYIGMLILLILEGGHSLSLSLGLQLGLVFSLLL